KPRTESHLMCGAAGTGYIRDCWLSTQFATSRHTRLPAKNCVRVEAKVLLAHVVRAKDRDKRRDACGLLYVRASFGLFALHQAHHSHNFETIFAGDLNGLDCGGTGGTNVIDDDHPSALLTKALNALAGTMLLLGLANEEPAHLAADHGDRDHDGIGSHG